MERRSDGTVIFENRREVQNKLAVLAEARKVCVRSVRDPNRVMVIKDRDGVTPRFENLEPTSAAVPA